MEAWGYIGATAMGLVLGLVGGGGSILSVPLLVYLFGVSGALATYYSLAIVGTSALVGVLPYARRGQVEYRTGFAFLLPTSLGLLFLRRVILPWIPAEIRIPGAVISKDALILGAFAVVMLGAAVSMIRGRHPAAGSGQPQWAASMLLGAVVGLITGFVGAGGGFLIVPALVIGLRIPMERAIGTSLLIIALNSLIGFGGDWLAGIPVNWELILGFLGFALAGVTLGAWAGKFVPAQKLKLAFGWFVLLIGGWILASQLMHHTVTRN